MTEMNREHTLLTQFPHQIRRYVGKEGAGACGGGGTGSRCKDPKIPIAQPGRMEERE
jgi:hypothetical protein